jgi:hypothetical protein
VSDADGDAVQAVWSLDGVAVQTDDIAAGGPPTNALLEYTATLTVGTHTLAVTATDSFGNVSTSSATLTVVDTTPPVIVSTAVSPEVLWPPNHKMIPVRVSAVVTDACGEATWEIVSISSNQAVDASGSGHTSPDWKISTVKTPIEPIAMLLSSIVRNHACQIDMTCLLGIDASPSDHLAPENSWKPQQARINPTGTDSGRSNQRHAKRNRAKPVARNERTCRMLNPV